MDVIMKGRSPVIDTNISILIIEEMKKEEENEQMMMEGIEKEYKKETVRRGNPKEEDKEKKRKYYGGIRTEATLGQIKKRKGVQNISKLLGLKEITTKDILRTWPARIVSYYIIK